MQTAYRLIAAACVALAPGFTLAQQARPWGAPPAMESLPPVAPAGAPTALTLGELEQIALANNPTLVRANAAVQAAQGKWTQEGLYPNPVLSYVGDEIGNHGKSGFQGGKVGQEIVTGGKRRLSQAVASHEIEAAQQQFAAQQFRVRNDVRMRFYDALFAQQMLDLSEQLVRVGGEGVRATDALFRAQSVSRVDVLQAQVEAETAQIQREKARNAHMAAWRRLAAVVGQPQLEPRPLAGNPQDAVPQFTWEQSLAQVLSTSPEMSAAVARENAARCVVERAAAEVYPNVSAEIGLQHDNDSGDDVVNVMTGIPLPVFNRNQGNRRKAEAELTAAQADTNRVRFDLQNRLAIAFERYANAREQAQRYEQSILPSAKTSLDLVAAGYREGEFGYLAMLTAQRTYFQTNVALIDSLRELRQSAVLIEGLLLSDSLGASESAESTASSAAARSGM